MSIWLDDLSPRAPAHAATWQTLIRDKHVVGVTTNPTIFARRSAKGDAYDEPAADLAAARCRRRARRCGRSPRTTSAGPATCSGRSTTRPTASTAGCRSRSTRGWPSDTDKTVAEAARAVVAGRPAQPVHQDPGHRRGPARDHPGDRRGHQRQRHADLLPGALPRGDGRLPDRPGAGQGQRPRPVGDRARWPRSSSPASTPRSTSGWTRSAPTRPRRCAARPRSPTPGSPTSAYEEVVGGARWQALAAAGAKPQRPLWASTGDQGPGLPRHHVRRPSWSPPARSTRCRSKTLDAVADHGEITRRHDPRAPTRRPGRCWPRSSRLGIDYDDVVELLEARGRGASSRPPGHELLETVIAARAARTRRVQDGHTGECRVHGRADGDRRLEQAAEAAAAGRPALRAAAAASPALAAGDPTLWGPEAAVRGGDPARLARPATTQPRAAAPSSRALRASWPAPRASTTSSLAGMGGSSLAPEVITADRRRAADRARHHRPRPGAPRAGRPAGPHRPGRRPARAAARSRPTATGASTRGLRATPGSTRPRRIVVVTDPGSPLEETRPRGRLPAVFLADPNVGGRYSALTAFGLVPSGAGRRRRRAAARRGGRGSARCWPRTTATPAWTSAPPWAAPRWPGATRS